MHIQTFIYHGVLVCIRLWCTSTRANTLKSSCLTKIRTKMISWGGEFLLFPGLQGSYRLYQEKCAL